MRVKPFQEWDLKIIEEAITKGFDISILFEYNFSYGQICMICSGLLEGLDVCRYAKPEIGVFEMQTIKSNLLMEKQREN